MTFVVKEDSDKRLPRLYQIEFHHINKASKLGRQRLGKVTGLNGLTTAVVISQGKVSIATAFCSADDQFSRERGREEALKLALRRCKPFREDLPLLLAEYKHRRPALQSAGTGS